MNILTTTYIAEVDKRADMPSRERYKESARAAVDLCYRSDPDFMESIDTLAESVTFSRRWYGRTCFTQLSIGDDDLGDPFEQVRPPYACVRVAIAENMEIQARHQIS